MRLPCQVKSVRPANGTIYQVELSPLSSTFPSFAAGQYLQIYLPNGDASAFSIASSPRQKSLLELNILKLPEQQSSLQLFQLLESGHPIDIEMPLGDCYLPDDLQLHPEVPIILVAAGTGFAQMKSMLYELFARGVCNPVHLYWGNRQANGFYQEDLLKDWHRQHPNFIYHLVVSDAQESCQWLGREGLLYETIRHDFSDLKDCRLCISGSPAMVYATLDELAHHGLQEANAYSDVFSYAPRPKKG